MRLLVALAAVTFVGLGACGRSPTQGGPPAFVFASPTQRVGARPIGERTTIRVPWTCRGSGRLRILGTRGNCGCAHIGPLPEHVTGGSAGTLDVTLTASRVEGAQDVRVTVYTDRPAPRDRATMTLRAWIGAPVVARPATVDLGWLSPGHAWMRRVELRAMGQVGSWKAAGQGLAALDIELIPPHGGQRGVGALVLHGRAPRTPGPFEGSVTATRPGCGQVRVPVRGVVVFSEGEGAPRR